MAMPTRSCAPGQLCVDHNNVTALNCAVNSYYFGLDLMCLTFESEKNNRGIESTTPVTLTTDTTCVSFLVTNIVASNCVRSPTHLQETGLPNVCIGQLGINLVWGSQPMIITMHAFSLTTVRGIGGVTHNTPSSRMMSSSSHPAILVVDNTAHTKRAFTGLHPGHVSLVTLPYISLDRSSDRKQFTQHKSLK
jgi:hypothetical protein